MKKIVLCGLILMLTACGGSVSIQSIEKAQRVCEMHGGLDKVTILDGIIYQCTNGFYFNQENLNNFEKK